MLAEYLPVLVFLAAGFGMAIVMLILGALL